MSEIPFPEAENLDKLPKDKHVSRMTELLEDSQEIVALSIGNTTGELSKTGSVARGTYPGDTEAEALGRAYHIRDQIRENGGEAEVTYIEPVAYIDGTTFHEVEIEVIEGRE